MNIVERLARRTGETDKRLLMDCVASAGNAILARRYPFGEFPTNEYGEPEVEPRYQDLQYRIALDMYNRIGAEGQMSHSENGINRSWGAEWISDQLLSEVIPKAGVTS